MVPPIGRATMTGWCVEHARPRANLLAIVINEWHTFLPQMTTWYAETIHSPPLTAEDKWSNQSCHPSAFFNVFNKNIFEVETRSDWCLHPD